MRVSPFPLLLLQILVKPAASGGAPAPTEAASAGTSILKHSQGGVLTLTLNRPDRYNAFNFEMYDSVASTLVAAGTDPEVKTVVITGAGRYYSSGNDLSNFMTIPKGEAWLRVCVCACVCTRVRVCDNF